MPNPTEGTPAATTPAPAAETPPAPTEKDLTNLALSRLGYALENELPPEDPNKGAGDPAAEAAADPAAAATPPAEGGEATPPAGDPAAAPAAPAAPPAAPAAPVEKVKIKPKAAPAPAAPTIKDIVAGVTEALRANQPPAPAAAAAPAAPVVDEPELNPLDKEELELAKFAAEVMPDKYKGFDAKVASYFKARDAEVAAIIKEEGEFDPNSERFQKFLREKRPNYHGVDRRRIETERIVRAAEAKAEAKIQAREREMDLKLRRLEVGPTIVRETAESAEAVLSIEDDVVKAVKADPVKAREELPFEAPIVESVANDVRTMTEEYLKIANGLVEPSADNPVHVGLSDLVKRQGELLDAMPQEQRVAPDGRVYISRASFVKLPEAERARYRTFDDAQVVTLIREFGKNAVATQLKAVRTRLEKSGYKKVAPTPAPSGAAPAAPAAPATPPKPTTAPKAGSAPTSPPAAPKPKQAAPHLKALGVTDRE